jgi:hypothetical protein
MSASDLTNYLEHLTIPVYDLGLDSSDTEVQIGTASGLADPHIVTLVNTVKISDPAPPNLQTQVLQHYSSKVKEKSQTNEYYQLKTEFPIRNLNRRHRDIHRESRSDNNLDLLGNSKTRWHFI